jgi:L-aminopeptidase/D-esterase-like protein
MKSGLGSAAVSLGEALVVGAVMVVNTFGDVVDPDSGEILAGARSPETNEPADTLAVMRDRAGGDTFGSGSQTVIGVVATNAKLTKEEVNKVAQMAQDGVARTVRPAHTMVDGDTLFALATGDVEGDVNLVGAYAAEVVAEAVVRAVRESEGAGGLPAWDELRTGDE